MATLSKLTDLRGQQIRPMTEAESRNFIGLITSDIPDEPQSLDYFSEDEIGGPLPFILAVMVQRLRLTGLQYSPRAIMFAGLLCDRPGMAVMWAYTLFCASRDGTPLTLDTMTGSDGPFAMGVPTEAAMHEQWDAQKDHDLPCGNLLDAEDTWKVPVDVDNAE